MRPGKPMRRVSEKRGQQNRERHDVLDEVAARDGRTCAAKPYTPPGTCNGWPLDGHEIIPRGRWSGSWLYAPAVMLVCRACHDWITHEEPGEAEERGLLATGFGDHDLELAKAAERRAAFLAGARP